MAITQKNAIHPAAAFQSEETGLVDGTGSEEEILDSPSVDRTSSF